MGFTSKLSSLASNQPAPPPPAAGTHGEVWKWIDCITRKRRLKRNVRPVRLNIWLSRALFGYWRLHWPCRVSSAVVGSVVNAASEGQSLLPPRTSPWLDLPRLCPRAHWSCPRAGAAVAAAATAALQPLHHVLQHWLSICSLLANDMVFAGCFEPPVIYAYLGSRTLDSFLWNISHY